MDKDEKEPAKLDWAELGREAGVMLSFLITAFSLASIGLSINPKIPWSLIALISFVIFSFLTIQWIYKLDSELSNKKPNIQIDGELNPHDQIITKGIARIHIVNIPFANNPKLKTSKNNAYGVLAKITYLDENKEPLFKWIRGRWTDTKFTNELPHGESDKNAAVDFPNNGLVRWLEILVKYPEDEYCYGFNNTSCIENDFWLYPDFQIMKKKFFIRVELLGNYLNNIWEFEVLTKGKGDTFQIRYGNKWYQAKSSQATKTLKKTTKKKSSPKKTS